MRCPRGAKEDNCRGASADGSRIDRELAIGPWGLRAASLSTRVLGLLGPSDVDGVWRQLEPVDQVVDRQLRVERSQGNQIVIVIPGDTDLGSIFLFDLPHFVDMKIGLEQSLAHRQYRADPPVVLVG